MKQKPVCDAMLPYLQGKVILIHKPRGWTSFDAVKKVRIVTGISKVGHAGTLDPLATGLLIVCTGKFTKKINDYMGMRKEYTGIFTLGAVTPTYDLESKPENFKPFDEVDAEKINNAVGNFTGNILQHPPAHSAIKKDGKRLYELARKGQEVITEARPVTIDSFEITNIDLPYVSFRVICSTGTYIRSLANDFGKALETGAYLSDLCRTKIGEYKLENALLPEDFERQIKELKAGSEGKADA